MAWSAERKAAASARMKARSAAPGFRTNATILRERKLKAEAELKRALDRLETARAALAKADANLADFEDKQRRRLAERTRADAERAIRLDDRETNLRRRLLPRILPGAADGDAAAGSHGGPRRAELAGG